MTLRDEALSYLTGALTGGARPEAVGRKFDSSGAALTIPGNTTLCRLDPASDSFAALVDAQDRLRAGPLARAFVFLPADSLHMTLLEGVIDDVRTPERWPGHMTTEASVEDVTADFATRLRGLGLARTVHVRPEGLFGGFSLRMTGTTPRDAADLRRTRDILRGALDIQRPDHAAYRFHITLGYLLRWLTPAEADAVLDLSQEVETTLLARLPEIAMGPIEFCRFTDMLGFDRVLNVD